MAPGCGPQQSNKIKTAATQSYFFNFFFPCKLFFLESRGSPQKVPFSSHPLQSLNFPFWLNTRPEVLALCRGKKRKYQGEKKKEKKKKKQQTEPKQTNRHQKADEETRYEFSCELAADLLHIPKKNPTNNPNKGINQPSGCSPEPSSPRQRLLPLLLFIYLFIIIIFYSSKK